MPVGKKIVFAIAGGTAALIISAAAVILSLDINSYKTGIEKVVSDATGLHVTIKGRMSLSFFPFGVSARDVHVSGGGGEFLTLDTLTLRAEPLTLLRRNLKFTGGRLVGPSLTIIKGTDGKYNYESAAATAAEKGPPFGLDDLGVTKGNVVYLDQKTGEKIEFRDLGLTLKNVSLADVSGNLIKNISFDGKLECKEMLQKDFRIENIKAPVKAVLGTFNLEPLTAASFAYRSKKGKVTELKDISMSVRDLSISDKPGGFLRVISFSGSVECKELLANDIRFEALNGRVKASDGTYLLDPVTLNVFGGKGHGEVSADITAADALYKIDLKTHGIDFEKFTGSIGGRKLISGKGDLLVSVVIKEKGDRPLLTGTTGTFNIEGNDLTIHSMDLDKVLTKYETSQEFNLVDLGAYFVAGPLSTVALKGFRYGDLFVQTRGGQGTITRMVSGWKIRDGKAEAVDCALSTRHHRVALKGTIDLVEQRYGDVTVAILDEKGCAKFKQPVSGPFGDPKVGGTVNTIESLAGPVIGLYEKAKKLFGARCEVFYKGSVPQPR